MTVQEESGKPLSRVQRVLLVLFLFDIMVLYPAYNRVNESSMGNRLLLMAMIGLIFLAFARRWWRALTRPWDAPTLLLAAYFVWISLSLATSVIFGTQSPDALFTYGLNSLAPIILFACFVDFPERRFAIAVILLFTVLNIFVGIITLSFLGIAVPHLTPLLQQLVFDPDANRLGALVGKSTVIGYLAVFGFTWTLYFSTTRWRYPMLFLFAFATLFSFQRSMWAGMILALALYLFLSNRSLERRLTDAGVALVTAPAVLIILISVFDLSTVSRLLIDRFAEFNFEDAIAERSDQQLVLNRENALQILVGQGYGKYSPLNKDENLTNLPDAPFYMIFNETGVVGLGLFAGFLLTFAWRAVEQRNLMLTWLVVHLGIALLGSRVLWYFPLNFIIFMLLAMFKDRPDRRPPRTVEAT